MATTLQWFVGVDWATATHQVCVLDAAGAIVGERRVRHSGPGLAELVRWLQTLVGTDLHGVSVAIEVPRGMVVETLRRAGCAVFTINPKQVERLREQFTVAGAKDDRRDARVLATVLRTLPEACRRVGPESAAVVALRAQTRLVEELGGERTRLVHRVRAQLQRYYPAFLAVAPDLGRPWVWALWERVPTPEAAGQVTTAQLGRVLRQHGARRANAAAIHAQLQEPSLGVAPGVAAAATLYIEALLARLRLADGQLRRYRAGLVPLTRAVAAERGSGGGPAGDDVILRSVPGIGPVTLATLLGDGAEAIGARDYARLRLECGTAPVTRQSGKSRVVRRRYACNRRLAGAMHHMARGAVRVDPVWQARYRALRARGHGFARALRTIADRLLAVACAMLRAGTLYDPTHLRHAV